ncbi:CAF1 family ribonuclease-domain-containing protein [Chlamydoabsidia padenii]|nr:CAF1 family ribonuclease-domain-containing protein [Chlamydoabsidia padenii]
MEILKKDFEASLPTIRQALLDADFISIDAEFSGLSVPTARFNNRDDAQHRYYKVKQHVEAFMVVQYGVCAFKKTNKGYVAKPFNFYIYGGDNDNIQSQRHFLSNASSLSFLRSNHFDFNKLIDQGIPFYNYTEEGSRYTTSGGFNIIGRQNIVSESNMSKSTLGFLTHLRQNLESWLQNGTTKPLLVSTNNMSQKKLVYQEIQQSQYGGFLKAQSRDTRNMEIIKVNSEDRYEKSPQSPLLNFRQIIEIIKEAHCPVVIHNGMYDICHTVDQFWHHLPEKVQDFKDLTHDMWQNIVDTKYMAEFHPLLRNCFNSSVLGTLFQTMEDELKKCGQNVCMADGFDRYTDNKDLDSSHEAGYDAYMTGIIYLGFTHFIKEKEKQEEHATKTTDNSTADEITMVSEEEGSIATTESTFMDSSMTPFYNKIFLMRCDVPYIDIQGLETSYGNIQRNRFFLNKIPTGLKYAGLENLYPEIHPINVTWNNDNSAWITIRRTEKIDLVKLGPLGSDRVHDFVHGSRQAEGKACNITADAAEMEILSGEQWELLQQAKKTSESAGDTNQQDRPISQIPTGGSSYDDLDIPIPASFQSSKRERSPSPDEKDAKRTKSQSQ